MSAAPPPVQDLEAEAEVDLGRYARALAVRWWLLLCGLVAGALIGYVLSLGGSRVFRAQALVYLGQPLGINGVNQVQSLNTNPSTARSIVKSESVLRHAAAVSGMTPAQLRVGTSATPVAGAIAKSGQTPLVQVTVKGRQRAKVARAANALAQNLVSQLSEYSNSKIATLSKQQADDQKSVDLVNAALSSPSLSLSPTDKLLLQLRLTQLQDDLTSATQLLSLARNVEAPRLVSRAASRQTTARSHRNSTAVGGLIGLILGGIAALLWEPFVRRRQLREP